MFSMLKIIALVGFVALVAAVKDQDSCGAGMTWQCGHHGCDTPNNVCLNDRKLNCCACVDPENC
ncbi:uncharacterized protein L969DRAFT_17589 [Mixia osmundae IAM 14324]|uniref:uncharacterized protein n=1 Tax=Mixia osmundae (strain CBS 9802 / IAM 14324 / JCM 22182 / KY 12970) TaxID=764103 RepID=UPI0004A54681|nr:uncharacterized protein L969DRAFT_17589 [Mixia osmundae IAM 14324]KEI39778.1 hypothetical protein L969DRAFT_17589 [Mixia osmundae IAM 14324]